MTGLFRNVIALISGAILLVLGLLFSVVVLAVIAVLGLAIWGYLWWQTRKLRQAVRAQEGRVIDGEAVVVEEYHMRTVLPHDTSNGRSRPADNPGHLRQ